MHLDDGQLQSWIDQSLTGADKDAAAAHMSQCGQCRARIDEATAQSARVRLHLASLAGEPSVVREGEQVTPNTAGALDRYYARFGSRKENVTMNRIFDKRFRPAWAFVVVLLLLAASFTLAPVRAWAGQFLGLFRVQSIEVITVDPTLLGQLNGNSALGKQIGQLLSTSLNVTKEPGNPVNVQSVGDASQRSGFQVRLPASRKDAPQLYVSGGTAFNFTVNRKRAQDLLTQAGRSDLQLPASLDGATIKVNVPAGVSAAYGDCPKLDQVPEASMEGSRGRRFVNCIVLAEVPSPTIDTPPDLDIQKLAELGLQFTGMSAQQAHDYAQTVDWTSTLVVPIPRNAASYQEVTVDGVKGYLMQRPTDDAPEYSLVWVKNGIIYAIGGLGTDNAAAIGMANSMQ